MERIATWSPFGEWVHTDVDWVKVAISRDDLARFTKRSNVKGLLHTVGFLLIVGATGALSWFAFSRGYWLLLAIALYFHGSFYGFFSNALHELSHRTVFASKWLNTSVTALFGWLYWPFNPHLYRLSHQKYHHRYTLYQRSDGEDVPNYVDLNRRAVLRLFFRVLHAKDLAYNLYRLFTLTPTSKGWRGRGFKPDPWERFILQNASDAERRQVHRLAVACLVGHVLFVAVSIYAGLWFLPILVTFAPFYGPGFLAFAAGIHQHAGCDANDPDFRISCGDAILDPLSSFLYWRMEYHIEHHMFAAIPCYNLKRFSEFVADQLPPKERALPRLRMLQKLCREKYGTYQDWRDQYGRYKGL